MARSEGKAGTHINSYAKLRLPGAHTLVLQESYKKEGALGESLAQFSRCDDPSGMVGLAVLVRTARSRPSAELSIAGGLARGS